MRLQFALLAGLCALSCAEELRIRQDASTTTSAVSSSTTEQSQSSTVSDTTASSSSSPTSTNDSSTSPTGTVQSTGTITAFTSTGTANGFPTSTLPPISGGNSTANSDVLPLQPIINAPVGVGGALLMISGLALGFVGVRNRSVQTFLSTALLFALAVEVLIIYLMHPPVPIGVQGAYLVAGAVGGMALGALSLVFKEVSEGFGCVLGGFCFAMWILVLAPGGSIGSKAGKIILIAIMCVLGYASYISRFTRVYGLIICTSFAGATAFVLGIDCFSCAGLKEFWLYIWDLNPDEFPLFTNTYPINRPMQAEMAAIIIVCFLGTMSQIKIWQIVKEQRAKHDAQRVQDEEARNVLEEEVGRDVESRNARSLRDWEDNYEGKKEPQVRVMDSGLGSSIDEFDREGSIHDADGRRQSYPMTQLRPSTVDEAQSSKHTLNSEGRASRVPSIPELSFRNEGLDAEGMSQASGPATHLGSPSTGMPSPNLSVPRSSTTNKRESAVKRLSMMSLREKEVLDKTSNGGSPFLEEEDDDVASSVAATLDEPPNADALSVKLSRPNSMYQPVGGNSPVLPKEEFIDEDDEEALGLGIKGNANASSPSIEQRPGTDYGTEADETPVDFGEKTALEGRLPKKMSRAASNYRTNEWAKEVGRAEPEPVEEVSEHTADAVQIDIGDAAQSARANENNAAPAPPPPPPPPPPAPPAEALAAPAPKANQKEGRRSTQRLSRVPSGAAPVPVYSHQRRESGDSSNWSVPLAKRTSSNPRSSTTPMLTAFPSPPLAETRNPSAPILEQTLMESPVEQQSPFKTRPISKMPSVPNLLDERRERLDNRLTTTSFMTLPVEPDGNSPGTTTPEAGQGSQGDKASLRGVPENDEGEEMTLAERKAMVQRSTTLPNLNQAPGLPRQSSRMTLQHMKSDPALPPNMQRVSSQAFVPHSELFQQANASAPRPPQPVRLSSSQPVLYDAHPARRASTHNAVKQAQNWSAWRSSHAVATQSRNPYMIGDQQMSMLAAAKQQSQADAMAREQAQQAQQNERDVQSRLGALNQAHASALSKMQAEANRKAKDSNNDGMI